MNHITLDLLTEAVNRLEKSTFDSHDVIFLLLSEPDYQRAYIRELADAINSSDPILNVNAGIGDLIGRVPGVEKAERVSSMNMRGKVGSNQGWRIVPTTA